MRITLTNFKNHTNTDVDLKDSTVIEGRNGSGKTSILEAIMFVFYGRDFFGKVAVDGFVGHGKPECSASVELGGKVIKRTYSTEGNVYINGVKQRQIDFSAKFPPLELAYALTNPLYMLYEMTSLKLRALFMEYIPTPDPVEVFKAKYSKDEDMVERFRLGSYEEARKALVSLERAVDAMDRDKTYKEQEIYACRARIEGINAVRVRGPQGILKREKERQAKIEQLAVKLATMGNVKSDLQAIKDRLGVIEQEVRGALEETKSENLSALIEFYKESCLKLQKEDARLEAVIEDKTLTLGLVSDEGTCPVCGTKLMSIGGLKKKLEGEIAMTVELRGRIIPQLEAFGDSLVTATELKREAVELQAKLSQAKKKLSEFNNTTKKIAELRELQKGLSEDDFRRAVESESQKKLKAYTFGQIKNLQISIKGLNEKIAGTAKEIAKAEVLAEALSPQGVQAELAITVGETIQSRLKEYFPGREVSVKTVRKNKSNGNFREVFDIRLDKVHFVNLSFGEKLLMMVILGLVLREYVKDFAFNFVLLDEASVLSSGTLGLIHRAVEKANLMLLCTKASENDLSLVPFDVYDTD